MSSKKVTKKTPSKEKTPDKYDLAFKKLGDDFVKSVDKGLEQLKTETELRLEILQLKTDKALDGIYRKTISNIRDLQKKSPKK